MINRSKVSENGLITPDNFADDKNDPATSNVTNNDKK